MSIALLSNLTIASLSSLEELWKNAAAVILPVALTLVPSSVIVLLPILVPLVNLATLFVVPLGVAVTGLVIVFCLLLNVFQSVELKYPPCVLLACAIETVEPDPITAPVPPDTLNIPPGDPVKLPKLNAFCLLLNVFQSVELKNPFVAELA